MKKKVSSQHLWFVSERCIDHKESVNDESILKSFDSQIDMETQSEAKH